jgi:hypothetical protein
MNWTLVSLLALPGLMMGLLSVKGHTRGIEPYLWILLSIFAALVIARTAGVRMFLHGLSVGIAWGVINGLVAASLFSTYVRHNPEVVSKMSGGTAPVSPRVMFAAGAPVIGLVTGLVLGALCWGAGRVVKPAPSVPAFAAAETHPESRHEGRD